MEEDADENLLCTGSRCILDCDYEERFIFECNECKRLVHFRCSKIPAYLIQVLLEVKANRKGNKFKCVTCVNVNKDLLNHMNFENKDQDDSFNHSRDVDRLTQELQDLSFENDKNKSLNKALYSQQARYQERVKNGMKAQKENQLKIQKLQKDLDVCQTDVKAYEEKNLKMKAEIDSLRNALLVRQEPVAAITDVLNEKLQELEKTICKEIRASSSKVEEKMVTHTYADVAKSALCSLALPDKNSAKEESRVQVSNEDHTNKAEINLRTIILNAKNEELEEERERKIRSCNLIIHGTKSDPTNNKKIAKSTDEGFVSHLFGAIGVSPDIRSVVRLGKAEIGKVRPIKVVLKSERDKDNIVANLRNLKNHDRYSRISITDDYTIAERQQIKALAKRVKELNQNEVADSKYIWKLRGTPKNGLRIKKFMKEKPQSQTPSDSNQ